jgi:methionyl-tRNA formyltransferase
MAKLNVVFFGTPEFSVNSLETLANNPAINVVSVVSMPDRRAGRGKKMQSPAVIEFAKEKSISFIQTSNINKEEEYLNDLENRSIDFFVVLAFSQFLGSRLLNLPRLGAFNIHTSLLPKYRGAAPIQYALLNGDKTTGVSIQKMVKKMDAGDIVYSHDVAISPDETSASLFSKLQIEAAAGLSNFLEILTSDETKIQYLPQNEDDASFAPIITKSDGLILPAQESAKTIHCKSKAYYPWPGTFIYINGQRLKVIETELVSTHTACEEINLSFGTLIIGTIEGSIRLKTVQLDGKKPISDSEYINGVKNKVDKLIISQKDTNE